MARLLAEAKAQKVHVTDPEALVIGADTVVAYQDSASNWHQLAKPLDDEDAVRMLSLLSGRRHSVITGVAVLFGAFQSVAVDTTKVRFKSLSPEQIREYVATGEPMDKAGAYAIQGGAKEFVSTIEGSWSNVVGLPLEMLKPTLMRALTAEH